MKSLDDRQVMLWIPGLTRNFLVLGEFHCVSTHFFKMKNLSSVAQPTTSFFFHPSHNIVDFFWFDHFISYLLGRHKTYLNCIKHQVHTSCLFSIFMADARRAAVVIMSRSLCICVCICLSVLSLHLLSRRPSSFCLTHLGGSSGLGGSSRVARG